MFPLSPLRLTVVSDAIVNESNRTIKFVLPFGSTNGTVTPEIELKGVTTAAHCFCR